MGARRMLLGSVCHAMGTFDPYPGDFSGRSLGHPAALGGLLFGCSRHKDSWGMAAGEVLHTLNLSCIMAAADNILTTTPSQWPPSHFAAERASCIEQRLLGIHKELH